MISIPVDISIVTILQKLKSLSNSRRQCGYYSHIYIIIEIAHNNYEHDMHAHEQCNMDISVMIIIV